MCLLGVLPYLVIRAALGAAGEDAALGRYLSSRLSKEYDLGRCLEGVWAGLRVAWVFALAYVGLSWKRGRPLWNAATTLALPATLAALLFLSGDYSRVMSGAIPAALLGVWLLLRRNRRYAVYLLWGALLLNLALPAQHVGAPFRHAIHAFPSEVQRHRQPPNYLTGAAQIHRGREREVSGDLEGAMADYDEGIALDPTNAGAHAQRGRVAAKLGRWTSALADLERAVLLASDDWPHRAEVEELLSAVGEKVAADEAAPQ